MAIVAILLGSALLILFLHDVFEVMLLPRRVRRRVRLVRYFYRWTWTAWGAAARLWPTGCREAFLSHYGPLSMVMLMAVWATGLIVAFAALQWGLQAGLESPPTFTSELYLSGATFFTLGYGDITPTTRAAKAVAVAEAGTGFGFIAVVIGYLPVLYQLFSRREAHVIMLDGRAGSPPTAAALLCRHSRGQNLGALDGLLHEWESWLTELLESHLSYPMLGYYRSQHDNQSWLAAVTAILDACALLMVGFRGVATFQAQMTYAVGRLTAAELARVFRPAPAREHRAERLSADSFRRLQQSLSEAGLIFSDPGAAEERLTAFRATYEPLLQAMARHLRLQLPGWLPAAGELDNWQSGPRGRAARELVADVPAEPR